MYQKKVVMYNYEWNCDDFMYQKKLFMYNNVCDGFMYQNKVVMCKD